VTCRWDCASKNQADCASKAQGNLARLFVLLFLPLSTEVFMLQMLQQLRLLRLLQQLQLWHHLLWLGYNSNASRNHNGVVSLFDAERKRARRAL